MEEQLFRYQGEGWLYEAMTSNLIISSLSLLEALSTSILLLSRSVGRVSSIETSFFYFYFFPPEGLAFLLKKVKLQLPNSRNLYRLRKAQWHASLLTRWPSS